MADPNDFLRADQARQSLIASTQRAPSNGIWGIGDTQGFMRNREGFLSGPILKAGGRGKKPAFGGLFSGDNSIIAGFKKCAEAGAVRECNPAEVYGQAQHGLDSGIQAAQIEKPQIGPDIQTMGSHGRG